MNGDKPSSRLLITASPHLSTPDSTPTIMWSVVGSLVPIIVVGAYFFGPGSLLVVIAATFGATGTEGLLGKRHTLLDGSAAITGLLLGLTLPPGIPLWMAFLGGVFGVGFGKVIFGGLGQNVFNPALLGRAFLQAAFPVAMTTWPALRDGDPWWVFQSSNFALPLMSATPDAITGATPLGLLKFEGTATALADLASGSVGGSIGETSGVVILVCGVYLALRNYLNWRIPASIFLTVGLVMTVLNVLDPERFPSAMFMLFSGGLMLGAVYMATDMVTSPVTNAGSWLFGSGIGLLVVIIRLWGGLAEGVMYAILLMNALVPFIDRATQSRVFGTPKLRVRGPGI